MMRSRIAHDSVASSSSSIMQYDERIMRGCRINIVYPTISLSFLLLENVLRYESRKNAHYEFHSRAP